LVGISTHSADARPTVSRNAAHILDVRDAGSTPTLTLMVRIALARDLRRLTLGCREVDEADRMGVGMVRRMAPPSRRCHRQRVLLPGQVIGGKRLDRRLGVGISL